MLIGRLFAVIWLGWDTFGQAYSDYAARTPAVIPRIF